MIIGNASASSYTLTVASSGSQSIDVTANTGVGISVDNINVATTCRYGYNFTINTSVSDNNLYLGGDSSNNTEGTYFSSTDGTSALNATTNKWGYYYNTSTVPTNTSVFSPVPTLSSPATVKTPLTTPASSDINDNFNIYYGVSSSPTMAKGTYKMIPDTNNSNNDGTIVYTATIANECLRYTVQFNPTSQFEGNTLSGTGTVSDQTLYEGVATALTANGFTAPSGYYFAGWNTAQDGSGIQYTNQQEVTDLASAGSTVTLYAMWTDCPPNTFCYNANVSNPNDVEGEMGNQTILDSDISAILWAPNYKRDNYGFASWNTNPSGTGTNYGPNQTLEFNAGAYSTGGVKLYAKWTASAGNMQNWTCPNDTNMPIGTVTALKDARDNNVYAIAKLADGKCWMIENLRLDDSVTLSSSNTHNPSLPITNTYSPRTTSYHLSSTINPYNTTWCVTYSSDCMDQSMLATNNTTLFINNTFSSYSASSDVYSYGNYYNWYSATAGYGKYDNNNGAGYHAPGDICPAGWHLPKGGGKSQESINEFWSLIVVGINNGVKPANYDDLSGPYYSGTTEAGPVSNALRAYPNNFVISGYVDSSLIGGRNSNGYYWTASGYNRSSAHGVYIERFKTVTPGTNYETKWYGRTIRCVAGT